MKDLHVTFTEPVIKFDEFAGRTGVSVEAVRTVLDEKTPEGYVFLPDSLIRKEKISQLRKQLDREIAKKGRLPLTEAMEIAQKEGIDLTSTIETLGYKIVWHGINAEKAVIIKLKTR